LARRRAAELVRVTLLQATAPSVRPSGGRTALLILLTALGLALALPSAVAEAGQELKIRSHVSAKKPSSLLFAAHAPRSAKRVVFYVDGRRRWVDRRFGWRFGRTGHLRTRNMRPGRHRLTIKVRLRSGQVRTATTSVRIRPTNAPTIALRQNKPKSPKGTGKAEDTSTEPEITQPAAPEPSTQPTPDPGPAEAPLLDAGFENGLEGWNTAGVGEVQPTVVSDVVRHGSHSARFALTGSQSRSELILGGNGSGSTSGTVELREGDERYYAFSFLVGSMTYGRPGAHNLLMQFKSDGSGGPNFGLQLWDYQGNRGLWSHSDAMGGDRYLQPITHGRWHDVVLHFKASRQDQGFYRLYLDGELIDSGDGVSLIRPDRSFGYIKAGLYRNGGQIPGPSEIRLDAARLGTTLAQVRPG
jgi:hypothetical protein